MSKADAYAGRALAFLGDAVWSVLVRKYLLVDEKEGKGNILQRKSTHYVSAKAQASFYQQLHVENFFTEEEEAYFRRGRNAHTGNVPKNTEAGTYRLSTGFEAIIGALSIEGNDSRISEIWEKVRRTQE